MITTSRTTLEFSNHVALFFNLCKLCYVLEYVGKQSEEWGDYRVYLVKFLFDQGRLDEHWKWQWEEIVHEGYNLNDWMYDFNRSNPWIGNMVAIIFFVHKLPRCALHSTFRI
jgi:hypothetical protein